MQLSQSTQRQKYQPANNARPKFSFVIILKPLWLLISKDAKTEEIKHLLCNAAENTSLKIIQRVIDYPYQDKNLISLNNRQINKLIQLLQKLPYWTYARGYKINSNKQQLSKIKILGLIFTALDFIAEVSKSCLF
jgi:hypothetical protein